MTARGYEVVLRLERLPFFTGPVAPGRGGIRFLPFHLAIDRDLGLVVQEPLPEVCRAVEDAYRAGSMLSVPLGEGTFGPRRLGDALDGLLSAYGAPVAGGRFLEVGCGTGSLLARLAGLGARVRGCEVGPQAREAAERYGVPVIQEPFSAAIGGGPYDCIYSYGVFEHIAEVEIFLRDCRALLAPGGLFFAVVPDCGPMLRTGDATMLAHEHFNYFTSYSAGRLLSTQGFVGVGTSISIESGELRLFGQSPGPGAWGPPPPDEPADNGWELARRYGAEFRARREALAALLRHAEATGWRVGFYAGGYQYADLLQDTVVPRFFDGDAALHGKAWLAGLPAIESPWNLRTNPCDVVVIFPRNYLAAIRNFLVTDVGVSRDARIVSVEELLDMNRSDGRPGDGRRAPTWGRRGAGAAQGTEG